MLEAGAGRKAGRGGVGWEAVGREGGERMGGVERRGEAEYRGGGRA